MGHLKRDCRPLSDAGLSLWEGWSEGLEPFGDFLTGERPKLAGFGTVLAAGWDTIEEAFAVQLRDGLGNLLDGAKAAAAERDTPVLVELAGERFQVSPRGAKGGVRWWLNHELFSVKIRPGNQWSVSVRLSAGGLWTVGVEQLRHKVLKWVETAFRVPVDPEGRPMHPDFWQRISEAHFAVDVHAESFTGEMVPGLIAAVVAPKGVKSRCMAGVDEAPELVDAWCSGGKLQTLTIGPRRPLEIQVYDKGREIHEASGKSWMLDLWERAGWERPDEGRPVDVWRVEVRMRTEWLRDRGVVHFRDLQDARRHLVAEALSTRRLTRPLAADSNRSRWPAHELWKVVAWAVGKIDTLPPLGRRLTERGETLLGQLVTQALGVLRAATVLRCGDWDEGTFRRLLFEYAEEEGPSVMKLFEGLKDDEKHLKRVDALIERYRHVACPV